MAAKMINEITNLLRRSVKLGRTNHKYSMKGVLDGVRKNKEYYRWSSFSGDVTRALGPMLHPFTLQTVAQFQANLTRIARNMIYPAYLEMESVLKQQYMPNLRKHEGVWSLDGGIDYYAAALKSHTTVDLTPAEVHELGEREVARIAGEMLKIAKSLGFKGTLHQFNLKLKQTPRFLNHTKDQMIKEYKRIIVNRINPRLDLVIKGFQPPPVSVVPRREDGPNAYLSSTFYANVFRPNTKPSFSMLALTLHETNPGHHLQNTIMQMYEKTHNLSLFRVYLPGMEHNAAPFSFPKFTAYTEGWALYAEKLGEDMGLLNDTYERYGRYSSEMFRACRLVVDTGLHAFKWTKQQAIKYFMNYTASPLGKIDREINRYITWPGQACAYKIGELKMTELRSYAEKKLGDAFDLRDFHDVLLRHGRMPLDLLDKVVRTWIDGQAPKNPHATKNSAQPVTSPTRNDGTLVTTCPVFWKALLTTALISFLVEIYDKIPVRLGVH